MPVVRVYNPNLLSPTNANIRTYPAQKPMAWRAMSAFYSCVLRPLCWAGVLLEQRDQGSKRSDAVFLKTPLWRAWLQLDTDDLVEPAKRH